MIVGRREFLKLFGATAGSVGVGACDRRWSVPARLVDLALRGPGLESERHTVCGLCESGCGLTVRLVDGLAVGLKGNPRHPLNRGGLCPVGKAGLDVLYAPDRLRGPLRRGADGAHHPTTWEAALDEIAARLGELRAAGRGSRVALLSGEPGRLFHELADAFAAGLGASPAGRLGAESAVPYRLTQGLDEPPGFDLAHSDLVLSFGLDLFEDGPAPLHAISALIGARPTASRAALLHVGTRLSPSATKAESYLAVEPGTHGAAALGIAHVLVREGRVDQDFLSEHTFGFEDWTDASGGRHLGFRRLLLERYYPDRAAGLCGCEPRRLVRLARRLAEASAPVALAGGDALTGSNAGWAGMAVHALNALLGAFERPGGVMLPAPIPFTRLPGSAAAASPAPAGDPVEAIVERAREGEAGLDALILLNANPVQTSPAGERLGDAMERIGLVVACAPFLDETAGRADLVLPTPTYLETWRDATTPATVAFSVLGLGSPVIEPLHDTRHPGDVLLELARRDGAALPWSDYEAYLGERIEGLMVSGQGAVLSGSFEESWVQFLERRGWRFLEQTRLEDFRAGLAREGGWWNPVHPPGDWARQFRTPSARFEFYSRAVEARLVELGAEAAGEPEGGNGALARGIAAAGLEVGADEACLPHFEPPVLAGEGELVLVPFRPITARGDLGAASPMLLEMFGYPVLSGWQTWAELSPETARRHHLGDGDRVRLESDRGSLEAVVVVRPGSKPGTVHVPLGLGRQGPAQGVGSNPLAALAEVRDPIGGTLALTSTRVRPRLVARRRHGGPAPSGGHA